MVKNDKSYNGNDNYSFLKLLQMHISIYILIHFILFSWKLYFFPMFVQSLMTYFLRLANNNGSGIFNFMLCFSWKTISYFYSLLYS